MAVWLCVASAPAWGQQGPPQPATPSWAEPPAAPPEPTGPPMADPDPMVPQPPTPTHVRVDAHAPDAWHIEAQRASYDPRQGVLEAQGDVIISGPGRVLRANAVQLHLASGKMMVQGPVLMAQGSQVVTCSSANLDLKKGTGVLEQVQLTVHQPMDAVTQQAVVKLGQAPPGATLAIARGRRVRLKAGGALSIEDAYLTPCHCQDGSRAPLSVTAARANVTPGERATVFLPVFRILDVPVAVAPVWVVPLKPRLSGLLFPQVRLQDGLWVQQPLYLTLGDSADITVAPGVVTQRGPRLYVEGRAAPSPDTWLQAEVTYQRDAKFLGQHGDPARSRYAVDAWVPDGRVPWRDGLALKTTQTPQGERLSPDRFSVRLTGRSQVGDAALAHDVNMVSDRFVPGDFGASLGERVAPYLRSSVAAGVASGNLATSIGLLSYQDLQQPNVMLVGQGSARLPHRFPAVRMQLLEMPLGPVTPLGPLLAGRALLSLDKEWLLGSGATREALDVPGRTAGGARAVVQPELVMPLRLGRFAGIRLTAGGREALFVRHNGSVGDVTRMYFRTRTETEITGRATVGVLRGITHRIRPYVASDAVLWTRGSDNVPLWMDVWDRVTGPYHVVGAGVAQQVDVPRAPLGAWRVRTDLHSAVDVLDPRASEIRGGMWVNAPHVATVFRWALEPSRREITFVNAGLDVGHSATPRVHLGYTRLSARAARFLMAGGEDTLGGLRMPLPVQGAGADRLDALVALPLGGWRVEYGAELALKGLELNADAVQQPTGVQPRLLTHGGGLTYTSACGCWEAGARVRFWPGRSLPDVGLTLSLNGPDGQLALFR